MGLFLWNAAWDVIVHIMAAGCSGNVWVPVQYCVLWGVGEEARREDAGEGLVYITCVLGVVVASCAVHCVAGVRCTVQVMYVAMYGE